MRTSFGGIMRASFLQLLLFIFFSAHAAGQGTAVRHPPPLAFGTNIGHWLSQAKLDRAEMASFFTETDVTRIKGWGMDHIRVPVDSPLIASDTDREHFSEEGLSWIDRAAAWTRAAGLTLVLDLHHLPGHGFMSEETNTIWTASRGASRSMDGARRRRKWNCSATTGDRPTRQRSA